MTEQINHPRHYGGDTTYEVIKVLQAWGLHTSFSLGNAVKYISRAGKKGGPDQYIIDLQKAQWYLSWEIAHAQEMQRLRSSPPSVPVHPIPDRPRSSI